MATIAYGPLIARRRDASQHSESSAFYRPEFRIRSLRAF
jgi:hypothetical protein